MKTDDDSRGLGRRGFLGALGATVAIAGTEGCRRAVERVVPYATSPEQVIPGVASHYATVYARRGDALGLVVESHEGRPTKIEGNPLHPSSLGGADLLAQASVLDLYDPDRSRSPRRAGGKATWEAAENELKARLASLGADGGARLRILAEPTNSPTVLRLRATLAAKFPKARLHTYAPVDESNARAGAALAYGLPLTALPAYDRARVILSLDSDFRQTEPGNVRAHKLFSAGRKLDSPADSMSRLYVAEPALSITGCAADHRLRLPSSQIQGYAAVLANELVKQGVSLGDLDATLAKRAGLEHFDAKWIQTVARDLTANKGRSIVVAGSRQPPVVHALAHAMNEALGNIGSTVRYVPVTDLAQKEGTADLGELVQAMDTGAVDTLFILGGNPAYDAPADLGLSDKLAKVALTVHLASFFDETSAKCTWHLPRAHELEAWGDQRALDGTVSVQQPLIAPLFDARSEIELLALLSGSEETHALELVRTTLRPMVSGEHLVFEHAWKKALRDGIVGRQNDAAPTLVLRSASIAKAIDAAARAPAPSKSALEVVFMADAKMLDGRHANNTWLQELPDPITKVVWDNAALVSPATAEALGLESGDLVRLSRGGRSIKIAVFVVPGTADDSIALPLGWGRKKAGKIGNGHGFDVYPLRATDGMHFASGVTLTKLGEQYTLVRTQKADSMQGRPLSREATLAAYKAQPHFAELESPPKRSLPLWKDVDYSQGHQWGMAIDLNACTGCSACVVACQSENNVPVVGKEQVQVGREMHWLRLDRYFVEDPALGATPDDPLVALQPIACVQCEEAPCENVCPVAALEHSAEGLSEVTYNRCIGTRYCANNCPYKVRRFNYLNWHNDGVWAAAGGLPETLQMQQNPNVTVRFRGVIEKCTYCVQRIQSQRFRAKREGRPLRDGEIVTACQQTCPADAIVFGDLNDMQSRVAKLTVGDRRYALLEELGTKPRTTYLARVRNPNPEMA